MHSNSGLIRSWNNFLNAFRLAMASIRAQKLRSFLTLLGVIIGVASVIMVGAAIEGLSVYAEQSTAKAFGSESFLVAQIAATGRLSRREYFEKVKRNKPIHTDDARFLEVFCRRSRTVQPVPAAHLRCEARKPDLRGQFDSGFGRRHGGHSRYRRGGWPLLHGAGRPFPRLCSRDWRYGAHHALSRRCFAARPDGAHRRHRIHGHWCPGTARFFVRPRPGQLDLYSGHRLQPHVRPR